MWYEDQRSLSDRVGRLLRRFSSKPIPGDRPIEVGQRYFRVTSTAPIWVVRKVYTPDGHTIPHVVIERANQSADQNVIAIDRLLDDSTFRLDRRSYRHTKVVTERLRRRRDDTKHFSFR
jgi:hypothetical protein